MRTFVKVVKGDLVKSKEDWFPDNVRVYLPVAARHFRFGSKSYYYVDSLCLDFDGEPLYVPNNLVTDIL